MGQMEHEPKFWTWAWITLSPETETAEPNSSGSSKLQIIKYLLSHLYKWLTRIKKKIKWNLIYVNGLKWKILLDTEIKIIEYN